MSGVFYFTHLGSGDPDYNFRGDLNKILTKKIW